MKPGLGRAIPKWVVDAKRRQERPVVNVNIYLDKDMKSADPDKNPDIVSRFWNEILRHLL